MADRLRESREKRGLRNSQVALYLGITTSYVSQLENGKKQPSLEMLTRLVEYYDVSADYLLGLTDDPTRYEGPAPVPYVTEIIRSLSELSDARRYELWKIAEALVAVELAQPSPLDQAIAKATGKQDDDPHIIGGTE